MLYRVSHTTVYEYTEPVSTCHNIVHLGFRETSWQQPHHWEVIVTPQPEGMSHHRDYFGNHACCFALEEPHDRMVVTLAGEVEVRPRELPADSMPCGEVIGHLRAAKKPEDLDAYEFAFPSRFISPFDDLAELTSDLFTPQTPILEAAWALTRRIHERFTYDPKATNIATPLPEVFETKRGVCQDYAHLQIGCLRRLGLPARYVSGYLRTLRSPAHQEPILLGADASHAWVSVYDPACGRWFDFDPTNHCIGSEQHVTVAWGRDYGDISPIRGVLLGSANHTVKVAVEVREIEAVTV